ncbi:cytochrome c [Wenzhouxiangella sp. AB-CW3]|uniref:c-type cytochrome n=1 Tax=Wenzhouxiangella sp. AB-CW3 TaxID=2771012 RepID=UPI00168B6B3A|nr:cytochrome c [Wenzhouxiangella sp. AB-CW3]QOC21644.1 cytochrome c [Wenzhouxiangella sp. AB-CW3]
MRRSILIAAAAALMLLAHNAQAGNPSRGLEISQDCQACHGRDGNLVPDDQTPRLAGQYEDYLIHALKAYRSGERENALMQGFAGDLSDQDIRDLAAWYSRQEGLKILRIR